MEKKGPACTGNMTKSPTMGSVEPSKAQDGGKIEGSKNSQGSSKAEGQDKGSMCGNMSVKSSFGNVNNY